MRFISVIFIFGIILLFTNENLFSEETNDSTFRKGLEPYSLNIPSYFKFKFGWSNKSIIEDDIGNNSNSDKPLLKNISGNNFYGVELGEKLQFTPSIGLIVSSEILFGNVNGGYSAYFSMVPKICIGGSQSVEVSGGIGPAILLTFSDKANKYGGIGLSSLININYHIYSNFGIYSFVGFEYYGSQSYRTMGFGISISE